MNEIIIKAESLSKQYRIGGRQRYKTFRETLVEAATAPFRRLARLGADSSGHKSKGQTIWALKDVSFEVKRGEVVGIIGRNGAGKSTLLKILSRITSPTEGRVELKGRVGSLLEVGTGFHPELTGHENVYLYGAILGMDRWEVTRKFDEIVAFAELEKFIDTPVKRYSSGMYMRLAFAVAAHLEPEILLIDEVLAVGDIAFQKKCLGKMEHVSKAGRTILFVSHNLAAVNSLCPRVMLIERGQIEKVGPADEVIKLYKTKALESVSTTEFEPGLWRIQPSSSSEDATIEAVEMVNPETGNRLESIASGDPVAFRIHYSSAIELRDASFRFGIRTEDNIVLINCMSQRVDGVETPLHKGTHYIDCIFSQFPLAAGEYFIMVGIAHTMVKWLYNSDEFGRLTVLPKYDPLSQRALTSDLAYLYTRHRWRLP
jgi:lipopolysaccharide transport system ATP-binding protein